MSRGILVTISIFVIAILVVIIGFFLLDIENIALNFWAFASLLFSFVVSLIATITLVAPKKNKDNVYYIAGLSSLIWIYEIAVIISVLFLKSFTDRVYSFVFLQILINALFFITMIIIIAVSKHLYNNNIKNHENLQSGEYDKPKRGGF